MPPAVPLHRLPVTVPQAAAVAIYYLPPHVDTYLHRYQSFQSYMTTSGSTACINRARNPASPHTHPFPCARPNRCPNQHIHTATSLLQPTFSPPRPPHPLSRVYLTRSRAPPRSLSSAQGRLQLVQQSLEAVAFGGEHGAHMTDILGFDEADVAQHVVRVVICPVYCQSDGGVCGLHLCWLPI